MSFHLESKLIFLPQIQGSPTKQSLSRQSSRDSADDELEFVYDDGTKSRNPVRRSNSSPEMANWKNPFVHQKLENDSEKKDVRVSCEAIPEEIAGMGVLQNTVCYSCPNIFFFIQEQVLQLVTNPNILPFSPVTVIRVLHLLAKVL